MEVLESQDLSDGQIQQMLRDAEQRMRASTEAGANTLITTSGLSSLPGLDSRYVYLLLTWRDPLVTSYTF